MLRNRDPLTYKLENRLPTGQNEMQNKTLSREAQVTSKVLRPRPELKALEKRLGTSILCKKYTKPEIHKWLWKKNHLALFIPKVKLLSLVQLSATPWTVDHQAPPSMEFSRQEWLAISFSRGSSQPRNWTRVSCIAGRCFTVWATRESLFIPKGPNIKTLPSISFTNCITEDY